MCTCLLTKSLLMCLFVTSMDCSPPGSSVHVDFPAKNISVGCHALLQEIFPTQGSNPCPLCFLHWQAGCSPLAYLGGPCVVNGLLHFVNIMKAYPLGWDWSAHRKEHLFIVHLPTKALSVIHWKCLYLLPVLLIMSCDYVSKEYSWIHTLTHICGMGSGRQELQSNFSLRFAGSCKLDTS